MVGGAVIESGLVGGNDPDRVLLVDVPEAVQLARVIARDGIDEALARRMLAGQASRAERLALADDVIDNRGSEAALDASIAKLHQRYLALAAARHQKPDP